MAHDWLLTLVFFISEVSCQRTPGLYSETGEDPGIIVLDNTNFNTVLAHKNHFWLVELYASWCGHCRNFAPTFKSLAAELEPWSDILKVAAINCGDEINMRDVCEKADLAGFPTLKYYVPQTNDSLKGGVNRQSHNIAKTSIIEDTVEFMQTIIEDDEYPDIKFPDLSSITINTSSVSFEDIWPDNNEDTFVVIETAGSFLGRELILSTWKRDRKHPVIKRIITNKTSLKSLNVETIPAVVVLNRDDQSVTPLSLGEGNVTSTKAWKKEIMNYMAQKSLRNPSNFRQSTLNLPLKSTTARFIAEVSPDDVKRRRYSVYLSDLEKTVAFAISNEVGLQTVINGTEKLTALRHFLSTLLRWFPQHSQLTPLISASLDLVLEANTTLNTADLRDIFGDVNEKLSNTPWKACKGSNDRYGGYSCGLWMLWHQLTVAQYNDGAGEVGTVLKSMVEYVREFFSCLECARHFLQMVENGTRVQAEVKSHEDQVLFLWRDHNKVNIRLRSESKQEDPAFPKIWYPSSEFCENCYNENIDETNVIADKDINKNAVLEFMLDMYTASNIMSTTTKVAEVDRTNDAFGLSSSNLLWLSLVSNLLMAPDVATLMLGFL